ncbi:multicopper oxidase domain-containing protein [Geomonas subterranea]|uniref:Multicopper oxidase domain-containing protein n=2 Tax=Geomonas subterranea TaxID=2847989 RepID=A0ABX8LF30_9BACT|nr:multicopper oxidase domain-containing protein [Geomonas subterranea]QXM07930.1 multicopper oxidase domain-containing protein [Geomonas subterranea]
MRTRLVASTLGAVALVTTCWADVWGGVSAQVPLAGSSIPQFVDRLPDLDVIPAGGDRIELRMREFKSMVLPANAVAGYTGTWVWGYLKPGQVAGQLADGTVPGRQSFIGPVIVATRGVPTEMKFVNELPTAKTTNVLAYRYSTDQTLHWADPLNGGESMCAHMAMPPVPGSECASNYGESFDAPIPAAVHLHGGEVPPQLDGGPDSWFTSDGTMKGASFYSSDGSTASNYAIYRYPNSQEGAPIWFHDHTLGATRLNVYAGLAGAYLVTDPARDPANLPELVPLVVQDRMFDSNGQLFFTAASAGGALWALNPDHPYWNPEFVGDVIVVNGKSWPYKNVEAKRYTFLFLNGSNARTYEMALVDPVSKNLGPPLYVIGTDGGYLDRPAKLDPALGGKLVMMPGERYQVIVDFAGYQAGKKGPNGVPYSGTWLLRNTAKTPYPGGETPNGNTTGRIMLFKVGAATVADSSFNPAKAGATLRGAAGQGPALVRLANQTAGTLAAGVTVQKTRQLTLNEVMGMPQVAINPVTGALTSYPGGPLEILVNNTKWSGKRITGVEDGMYRFEPIPGFSEDATGNFISEKPKEGETEVWEIVNLTEDAHPIHLHLAQFQLVNRQSFDTREYGAAYAAAFPGGGYDPMTGAPYPSGVFIPGFGPPQNYDANPGNSRAVGGNPDIALMGKNGKPVYLQGPAAPALPQEAGWKDTIVAFPGQVTRIAVRWAPTDLPASTAPAAASFAFDPNGGNGYVWHCHIIDHEDNEMMRPDEVVPNAVAVRSYVMGTDY